MKSIFLMTLALGWSLLGTEAQVLKVKSIEKCNLPSPVAKATLMPSGDGVLLTDYNNKGLRKLSFKTGQEEIISTAEGAGYNAHVTQSGDVVYREISANSTQPSRRMKVIKQYNAEAGTSKTLVKLTRENVNPQTVEAVSVVTNNDFQLTLRMGNKETVLSPLGTDHRYIWPSVSPDGKKLLFYVSGDGAYYSDLDGKNPVALGALRAAKWLTDDIVVGQRDYDDGEVVTASSIIVKDLRSLKEQALTDEHVIAMYPSVSSAADKILFTTPEGEAFLIHVTQY